MKQSEKDVIISGNNLPLTEAIRNTVLEKMQKLFQHESHIVRIRIELGFDKNSSREKQYWATGKIEIRGPDKVVTVRDNDLYAAIDLLENKLLRTLRRRARLRRVKRKEVHAVDVPAYIPKAQVA